MRILILLLSMLAVAAQAADDYTGSWHNKKGSFDTLGFALRKDGRGIFGTATFPVILRWERTDTGILLKIAGEGQTTEMRLTYNTAAKTLVYGKPGGERETFWRISTDEPPDVEAQMEERRRKEQDSWPKSKEHKQQFASRDELLQAFQSWSERTPPNVHGLTLFVRPEDSSWRLSIFNHGAGYTVTIPTLEKSAEKLSPGLVFSPSRTPTEPDLPTRFALPKPQLEALRKWLGEQRIAFTEPPYEGRGPWQIEMYSVSVSISLKTDQKETLLSIARFLVTELFPDTKPPFHFATHERNGG